MQKIIKVAHPTATKKRPWKIVLLFYCLFVISDWIVPQTSFAREVVGIKYLCTWHASNEQYNAGRNPYSVRIVSRKLGVGELQFFMNGRLSYRYSPKLYPIGLVALDDGNLASIWSHGDGKIRIIVFAEERQKVVMKLNESSKMRPEFGYIGKERKQDFKKLANRTEPFPQCVLIPQLEWIDKSSTNTKENFQLIPVAANIFCWNSAEGKYQKVSIVEWEKRLD